MRGARFSLTEKDSPEWRKLKRELDLLKKGDAHVKVGVFGPKGAEERHGMTNADLAVIHEFGVPKRGIPERSFIRSTFDINRASYVRQLRHLLETVVEGELTVRKALSVMGFRMVSDIKKRVRSGAGIAPPLKAATIRRKKSSRPLVDTGRLLASVTHEVVLRDGEGE